MAPMFSLSKLPPSIILALGEAFGVEDEGEMDASAHYDTAIFQLMTYWSGDPTDPSNGVSRLALVMKHVALLMDPSRVQAPAAVTKAASNPKSNVVPANATQPPAAPVAPVKPRLTPDGFVILEFRPGEMLTTDQARERAGVGKSQLAKLLQAHQFVQPAGVSFPGGDETKQRVKVYYAVDVDKWRDGQILLGKAPKPGATDAQREAMARARDAQDALPEVNFNVLKDGSYLGYEEAEKIVGCSRSHLLNMMGKNLFPRPSAKTKRPGSHRFMSLFKTSDVENWVKTSHEHIAFQARKRRALERGEMGGVEPKGAEPVRAANDSTPDPLVAAVEEVMSSPGDVGTFRNGDSGGAAPGWTDPLPPEAVAPGEREAMAEVRPRGWMSLRDVASFIDTTETEVEKMVRAGRFPKPARTNPKLRVKEWAARQVVTWKKAAEEEAHA